MSDKLTAIGHGRGVNGARVAAAAPVRSREQRLVDYCFEFSILAAKHLNGKSHEEIAAWVAGNLAEVGFETKPCGMAWGVLVKKEGE